MYSQSITIIEGLRYFRDVAEIMIIPLLLEFLSVLDMVLKAL
jgi:hypothetical protein